MRQTTRTAKIKKNDQVVIMTAERGATLPAPRDAPSDDELVAMWLHGRPTSTQHVYRWAVDAFRAAVPKPLTLVTLADIQGWTDGLPEAANSRRSAIFAIKGFYRFCVQLGAVRWDPMAMVRAPLAQYALSAPSEHDIARVLAAPLSERDRLVLLLLYTTGARVSELARLRWSDIAERGEQWRVTVTGKGGRVRTVLLPVGAVKALRAYRRQTVPDAYVFRGRGGAHLTASRIRAIVARAGALAGLATLHPHMFRHAHATHAMDRGVPAHVLQASLGHSSLDMTARYLHANPDDSSGLYLDTAVMGGEQ